MMLRLIILFIAPAVMTTAPRKVASPDSVGKMTGAETGGAAEDATAEGPLRTLHNGQRLRFSDSLLEKGAFGSI